ncbi:hypothetical protein JIN85_17895, partial [Luteolibacter pohnpeiensis]|nr:hypothetical protein [Luteolibacter pohnpeiensis]
MTPLFRNVLIVSLISPLPAFAGEIDSKAVIPERQVGDWQFSISAGPAWRQ